MSRWSAVLGREIPIVKRMMKILSDISYPRGRWKIFPWANIYGVSMFGVRLEAQAKIHGEEVVVTQQFHLEETYIDTTTMKSYEDGWLLEMAYRAIRELELYKFHRNFMYKGAELKR
jgi:hypothetical protein